MNTIDTACSDITAAIAPEGYVDEHLDAMDKVRPIVEKLVENVAVKWIGGYPTMTRDGEWFIAQTVHGERVVLTALPPEYSYDFKTADHTYYTKAVIKQWMPFPDSQYVAPPRPEPINPFDISEARRILHEVSLGISEYGIWDAVDIVLQKLPKP